MELFSYHQTLQLLKPIQALPLSLEEHDLWISLMWSGSASNYNCDTLVTGMLGSVVGASVLSNLPNDRCVWLFTLLVIVLKYVIIKIIIHFFICSLVYYCQTIITSITPYMFPERSLTSICYLHHWLLKLSLVKLREFVKLTSRHRYS
jgi:hypothetical protein